MVKAGSQLASSDDYADMPMSTFEVEKILKGEEWVKLHEQIKVHYFGKRTEGVFLIMGTDSPDIIWTSPLVLSERGRKYVETVITLPTGHERLEFFQDYLEDEDEMLARDAYDEFAKAPYEHVLAIKDNMNRQRVLAWVKDTQNVPASRRRLYLTMLGVCGQAEDADLLESYMRSDNREDRLGLDALVACYLTLRGPDGMRTVEELFLANQEAEYSDTYAAIMAMRFHGAETEVIPKEILLRGFHCLLDRPELADLVIPDLARWEDWSVMPKLVELFRDADSESNWVRVPIINYVRACPLPEAKTTMAELQRIDPEAVKRASTFFPFPTQKKKSADDEQATADLDQQAASPPVPPPDDATDGGQKNDGLKNDGLKNDASADGVATDEASGPDSETLTSYVTDEIVDTPSAPAPLEPILASNSSDAPSAQQLENSAGNQSTWPIVLLVGIFVAAVGVMSLMLKRSN